MGAKPVVLVDGSSYIYRAYHALPPLVSSKGVPTGAVKGVINMIRRLQKDYPDSHIVTVFDAKGKTFRDDLYDQYKANRPPMPDDLRVQIQPIYSIIEAMGLPLLMIDGVEADDVIGTLAKKASDSNIKVIVSTGDKDLAQIVDNNIALVNTMTDQFLDSQGVKDKFGIPPELIIDYLALLGDKSDNIPGAPGVGEKTALALLTSLGNIKNIYQNLHLIPNLAIRGAKALPDKLLENRSLVELSYTLATIKTDVETDFDISDIPMVSPKKDLLFEIFTDLEFKNWSKELDEKLKSKGKNEDVFENLQELPSSEIPEDHNIETEYETVSTVHDLKKWITKINDVKYLAIDTETDSLDYISANLIGLSIAVETGKAAYIPIGHSYLGAPDQLDKKLVIRELKPVLEDINIKKVGQNIKFDMSILHQHGIHLKGISHDTMLESYVIDSVATRHDMDSLAQKYLEIKTATFTDVVGKGAKQITFDQVEIDQATNYAAEDADVTLKLHETLWPRIQSDSNLAFVFKQIEVPLISVLSRIERKGALIDSDLLFEQSSELAVKLSSIEQEAWHQAGEEFNLSSPKQIGEILFTKLKIPVIKKTATGAPSTKEEVLQELALNHSLPKILLQHRGLSKLKSTYTDKLPVMINKRTKRIHTSYNQSGTATGRLSSSDPNLQNIPIKSDEGRRVRQAFIAAPNCKIVAADYSQIELRIMAHLSEDKNLINAFQLGKDIHSATASEVFSVDADAVSAEQRRSAKAINFGLIYGMSAFGLSKQLGINRNQAAEYIAMYFDRYPGVRIYMDEIRKLAATQGYVETYFGRRLYLPEINSSNGMRRQAAERTAINAPMQGTAADIIKLAMISVDSWLLDSKMDSSIIMQVHDELVLEVAENELSTVLEQLEKRMANAAKLKIPLVVDIGIGDNWDQAH